MITSALVNVKMKHKCVQNGTLFYIPFWPQATEWTCDFIIMITYGWQTARKPCIHIISKGKHLVDRLQGNQSYPFKVITAGWHSMTKPVLSRGYKETSPIISPQSKPGREVIISPVLLSHQKDDTRSRDYKETRPIISPERWHHTSREVIRKPVPSFYKNVNR